MIIKFNVGYVKVNFALFFQLQLYQALYLQGMLQNLYILATNVLLIYSDAEYIC